MSQDVVVYEFDEDIEPEELCPACLQPWEHILHVPEWTSMVVGGVEWVVMGCNRAALEDRGLM